MTLTLEAENKMGLEELRARIGTQDLQLIAEPAVLFHPIRILIMKTLYRHMQVDFRDIQSELNLTAGNLASHLRALKKDDYVKEEKEIVRNRPRTTLKITPKGRSAYERFVRSLRSVLKDE